MVSFSTVVGDKNNNSMVSVNMVADDNKEQLHDECLHGC